MGALRQKLRARAHERGEIRHSPADLSPAEKKRLRRERKNAEENRRRAEWLRTQHALRQQARPRGEPEPPRSSIEHGLRVYVFTDERGVARWYAQAESRLYAERRIRAAGCRWNLVFVGSEVCP